MAGQQSGIKNVTYSFGDAVALMPLAVGWKPTDSDYLDFFDHFIEYKSPRASLLKQAWEPYNSKVYNEVYAAMSLCRTGPLYALKTSVDSSKPVQGGAAADKSKTTALKGVFDKVQEIEDLINTCLSNASNKTKITKNAENIRFDALSQLRVAAGDEAAKKIIVKNSHDIIKKMQLYFQLNYWNRESWNGLELFDDFFDKLNKGDADIPKKLGIQEENQYVLLKKILALYKKYYGDVTGNLTEANINTAKGNYCAKKWGVGQTEPPSNGQKEDTNKKIDKHINKFLWIMLIERLEVLNSIVSSFFSMVCCTRKKHASIVEKFMTYAIYYCVSPIFNCVENVKTVEVSKLSKEDTDRDTCLLFFKQYSSSFSGALTSFFGTEIDGKISALNSSERTNNATELSKKIQSPEKGFAEEKDHTSLFYVIESFFKSKFSRFETSKLSIQSGGKERFNVLTVYRDPTDDKTEIFSIMKSQFDSDKTAEKLAKIIAYSKIYFNTVAYGTFHKKKYELNSFKKYLSVTSNPLIAGQTFQKTYDGRKGETDAEFKKTRKENNDTNIRRVMDPSETWIAESQSDLTSLSTALKDIFDNLKLKEDFTPIALPKSTPRPKSASPNAQQKAKTAARPASAGGNAKKGESKSPIQKKQTPKKKDTKSKPAKAKGGK